MLKTFKYRLRPTKKQQRLMQGTLDECRWLYNHFLEERRSAWEERQESVNYHAQAVSIPQLKQQRPSLESVHSQVLQNVAVRMDLAFKAFFRRVKTGEEPGYPRFRGRNRYDSFTFPQVPSGCKIVGGVLQLSKIGHLRIVQHRPLEGCVKTCTIRRSATGKWFASFSCEIATQPLPVVGEQTGVDVGLESFAPIPMARRLPTRAFSAGMNKTWPEHNVSSPKPSRERLSALNAARSWPGFTNASRTGAMISRTRKAARSSTAVA